ncbi:MAG: OsmC family protein, partial [Sphingomonadales bacterium]
MQDTPNKEVNGVNVTALNETIEAVKGDHAIAKFIFQANNQWLGGALNRTTINDYYGALEHQTRENPFVFDNDEPPVLLGEDRGANPVEFLLHGLAGCLTTTLAFHAASRGIEIEAISSELKGDLDLRG